jgi:hypothetical protein
VIDLTHEEIEELGRIWNGLDRCDRSAHLHERVAATLARLSEVQRYNAAVCFDNGHVRSGVGDMDRCSRCGVEVTAETMKRQGSWVTRGSVPKEKGWTRAKILAAGETWPLTPGWHKRLTDRGITSPEQV